MTNDAKLQNTMSKKSAPKKRKIASLDKRKSRIGWYFVLPFLIGFVLIYLPVIFDSVKLSFFKINILQGGGYSLTPVGFENYQYALFEDPDFVQILISGMKELAFDIPAIIIFSLFMAVLLNQKMIGRAAFRAIFFIPVILATGLMQTVEAQNILGSYMDNAEGIDDGSGQTSTAAEIVSVMRDTLSPKEFISYLEKEVKKQSTSKLKTVNTLPQFMMSPSICSTKPPVSI